MNGMQAPEIVVTYSSSVVGNGVFWRGPVDDINKIRNQVAKQAARSVVQTGRPCTIGMWHVAFADNEETST